MADNFLQFSLSLPLKTIAERAWCNTTMAAFADLIRGDLRGEGDRGPDEVKRKLARDLGQLGQRALAEEWDCFDFEWSIQPVSPRNPDQVGALWIYADVSGSPDQVAAFLQMYLQKFDPRGALWFSWAYTCSKMRANEFGGGAVVVTASGSTFIDVQDWAQEQVSKGPRIRGRSTARHACTSR